MCLFDDDDEVYEDNDSNEEEDVGRRWRNVIKFEFFIFSFFGLDPLQISIFGFGPGNSQGPSTNFIFLFLFLFWSLYEFFFFWLWSLYKFRFLILVPLTVWLINKFATSVLSATSDTATSSSVYHMCVFVMEVDGRDENQKFMNLQGLF